jgi:hypothetical protein
MALMRKKDANANAMMTMKLERAIAVGNPSQRLSRPKTNIGTVKSLPHKKVEITASSKEMINVKNIDTKIPGLMRGKVIFLKVVNPVAPKS